MMSLVCAGVASVNHDDGRIGVWVSEVIVDTLLTTGQFFQGTGKRGLGKKGVSYSYVAYFRLKMLQGVVRYSIKSAV